MADPITHADSDMVAPIKRPALDMSRVALRKNSHTKPTRFGFPIDDVFQVELRINHVVDEGGTFHSFAA